MTTFNDLRARFDDSPPATSREEYLQRAALRGALLAFSNPSSPVGYPKPSNTGRPEATAAAHLAGQSRSSSPAKAIQHSQPSNAASLNAAKSSFRPQDQHSFTNEADIHPWYRVGIRRGSGQSLLAPPTQDADRGKSPSGIAASVAAARLSPQKVEPPSTPVARQQPQRPRLISENDPEPLDHLPPQGAVGGVRRWLEEAESTSFENEAPRLAAQKVSKVPSGMTNARIRPQTATSQRLPSDPQHGLQPPSSPPSPGEVLRAQGLPQVIHSPKPVRTSSAAAASIEAASRARERHVSQPLPSNELPRNPLFEDISPDPPTPVVAARPAPAQRLPSYDARRRPTPPPARRTGIDAVTAARNVLDGPVLRPTSPSMPPMGRTSSELDALYRPRSAASTAYDIPARRITPLLTGDSLANAIVGASLASSRTSSPGRDLRPAAPKRKPSPRMPFQSNKHVNPDSRAGSPSKGFKYTMRTEDSSSSEEERPFHKKSGKFGFRKHPNKHHEGDRKRWRDEITERERKRYEGVWAANKGIYVVSEVDETPSEHLKDSVSNIIVRDIWSRSRLPEHVLEEIWELVARGGRRRLSREEFVVGLWLVDQRLKGRKLPAKVGPSIWQSVVGIHGLKVPKLHY